FLPVPGGNFAVVFLLLTYHLCEAGDRKYNSVLMVSNGGEWGEWGKIEFCPEGHAYGFSLKVKVKAYLYLLFDTPIPRNSHNNVIYIYFKGYLPFTITTPLLSNHSFDCCASGLRRK
uniref:Galectin n=1 Tax=Podarcis muralis TaxID=64176 RepID=A0A670IYH6_PODMU